MFRKKHFSTLCIGQLQPLYPDSRLFLTHSATGALEMIAQLLDIRDGDEIIMPSFTFVSTANAFVSRGATPVFTDIDPNSLSMDVSLVEAEITPRTKAIVAVHYGGHACDLQRLSAICKKHGLFLIEDAAMGFGNAFEEKNLGGYGDFGVISFDITKQVSAIQGGLLIVNNADFAGRADDIYHIGTNRSAFMEGTTPYYEWVDVGSKYQMNELSAVVLYEHLLQSEALIRQRNQLSQVYFDALEPLEKQGFFQVMPAHQLKDNVHEFYIVLRDENARQQLAQFLSAAGIEALFHYIPLHDSAFGKQKGRSKALKHTESIAARLLRLPLHIELAEEDVKYVCEQVKAFFDAGK